MKTKYQTPVVTFQSIRLQQMILNVSGSGIKGTNDNNNGGLPFIPTNWGR